MITILVNSLAILLVQASAAGLHWVQLPGAPQKIIIVAEEGDSKEVALQNYLQSMASHKDLRRFSTELQETSPSELSWGRIEPNDKKKVMLLANKAEDLSSRPSRVMSFQSTYEEENAEVFVLPVAALKAVATSSVPDVLDTLSEQMDLVTSMGGDDISPLLYGRYNTYSVRINHERDRWESRTLKAMIDKQKVFVLGVCRGHQLVAVTQGLQLIQDIPSFVDSDLDHESGHHDIQIQPTKHSLFESLSGRTGQVEVNSLHHQAVKFVDHTRLEVAAVSEDGVVEAMEFKNGKGMTVQFHPEYMIQDWAKEILRNSMKRAGNQSSKSCDALLSAS